MPTKALRWVVGLLVIALGSISYTTLTTQAQTNLLTNPGFNNSPNYNDQRPSGSDYAFAMAPGWNGWFTKSPSTQSWMNIDPIAYPHTGGLKREGGASQNIGRGSGTFTAAVYQTIEDVQEGTTLEFNAWVFQESESGSGAKTRVGIGSNVGGNPRGEVKWSNWMTSLNSWQNVSVEATVPEGNVTVFIYSTQTTPTDPNQMYYDDASLTVVGSGDPDVADGGVGEDGDSDVPPPPTSTPIPQYVPFVNAQPTQEDGSVTHTVGEGDTLSSIAVAYGVPVNQIRDLNNLSTDVLRLGQQLTIREASSEPPPEPTNEESAESQSQATATDTDSTATESESGETDDGGFQSPTNTPQEVAQVASETPTEEEATEEPTPAVSPTPTMIPPTATEAAPAPVQEGSTDDDPLATESGVCVLMYDDVNQNRIRENDESLLAGGIITLSQQDGDAESEYTTNGESEPYCFDELPTGTYQASAMAPDGYGLTTSNRLIVSVMPSSRLRLNFGAAEGVEVASVPTPDDTGSVGNTIEEEPEPDVSGIRDILGIVVLGLAGIVLLGGVGVAFFLRGR